MFYTDILYYIVHDTYNCTCLIPLPSNVNSFSVRKISRRNRINPSRKCVAQYCYHDGKPRKRGSRDGAADVVPMVAGLGWNPRCLVAVSPRSASVRLRYSARTYHTCSSSVIIDYCQFFYIFYITPTVLPPKRRVSPGFERCERRSTRSANHHHQVSTDRWDSFRLPRSVIRFGGTYAVRKEENEGAVAVFVDDYCPGSIGFVSFLLVSLTQVHVSVFVFLAFFKFRTETNIIHSTRLCPDPMDPLPRKTATAK